LRASGEAEGREGGEGSNHTHWDLPEMAASRAAARNLTWLYHHE